MTANDPFALLRTRTDFTLKEAACIIAEVPTSRRYATNPKDRTQEQRDEQGRVEEYLQALQQDAEILGVMVTAHPAKVDRGISDFTGKPYTRHLSKAWTEYGKVKRDALRSWCEGKGLRPPFLFPDDGDGTGLNEKPSVAEMNADRAIAVMALLLAQGAKIYRKPADGKPNALQIGKAVDTLAQELFGSDVAGLASFRVRLGKALKHYPEG